MQKALVFLFVITGIEKVKSLKGAIKKMELFQQIKDTIVQAVQNFDIEEFRGNMRMFFEWIKEQVNNIKNGK